MATLSGKNSYPTEAISLYHWNPFKLNLSGKIACLEILSFLDIKGSHSRQVSLYSYELRYMLSEAKVHTDISANYANGAGSTEPQIVV